MWAVTCYFFSWPLVAAAVNHCLPACLHLPLSPFPPPRNLQPRRVLAKRRKWSLLASAIYGAAHVSAASARLGLAWLPSADLIGNAKLLCAYFLHEQWRTGRRNARWETKTGDPRSDFWVWQCVHSPPALSCPVVFILCDAYRFIYDISQMFPVIVYL